MLWTDLHVCRVGLWRLMLWTVHRPAFIPGSERNLEVEGGRGWIVGYGTRYSWRIGGCKWGILITSGHTTIVFRVITSYIFRGYVGDFLPLWFGCSFLSFARFTIFLLFFFCHFISLPFSFVFQPGNCWTILRHTTCWVAGGWGFKRHQPITREPMAAPRRRGCK